MSSGIFKYYLTTVPEQFLHVSRFGKFLHGGLDGQQKIAAWFLVDDAMPEDIRRVLCFPTGPNLHAPRLPGEINGIIGNHLFTVTHTPTGEVWHYFESSR